MPYKSPRRPGLSTSPVVNRYTPQQARTKADGQSLPTRNSPPRTRPRTGGRSSARLSPKNTRTGFSPRSPKSFKTTATTVTNTIQDAGTELYQETSRKLFTAASSALLGALSMGITLGWSAPAFDSLAEPGSVPRLGNTTMDRDSKTWIGSALTLGALFGSLFSGTASSILGRRRAVVSYGVPYFLGWLFIIAARSVTVLVIGRAILGIAAGLLSGTVPSYLIEITTLKYRGSFGASFQLFITIGIFLVYLFGMFLKWRFLSVVSAIPPLVMSTTMLTMPESPGWLLSKGRLREAVAELRRLRGPGSDIEAEMKAIRQELELSKGQRFTLKHYANTEHLMPLLLSLCLMFFQQFSGINVVMFYATDIFKEAGSTIKPQKATAIIGLAQVLATGVASTLVDRVGRRMLLIISGSLHTLSLALMAVFYVSEDSNIGWLPLLSLVIFIIAFSLGWGPVPWLMTAELTPLESRSTTCACATLTNWTCAFLIVKNFEVIKDTLHKWGTFAMFSCFCAVSVVFVVYLLPETKGKSPEQIGSIFKNPNQTDLSLSRIDSSNTGDGTRNTPISKPDSKKSLTHSKTSGSESKTKRIRISMGSRLNTSAPRLQSTTTTTIKQSKEKLEQFQF